MPWRDNGHGRRAWRGKWSTWCNEWYMYLELQREEKRVDEMELVAVRNGWGAREKEREVKWNEWKWMKGARRPRWGVFVCVWLEGRKIKREEEKEKKKRASRGGVDEGKEQKKNRWTLILMTLSKKKRTDVPSRSLPLKDQQKKVSWLTTQPCKINSR